jgi:hypothetical protein
LSPVIEPAGDLALDVADGRLEIVLRDGTSPYRNGRRSGWHTVNDRSWFEREAWRFDGR